MTTHHSRDAIAYILTTGLPTWASKLQLHTLVDRFMGGYDFGWLTGGGVHCGWSHSERGAQEAAQAWAARNGEWTHVIRMRELVDSHG